MGLFSSKEAKVAEAHIQNTFIFGNNASEEITILVGIICIIKMIELIITIEKTFNRYTKKSKKPTGFVDQVPNLSI